MERAQVSGAATWTRGWSSLVGSGNYGLARMGTELSQWV